ncbi:hypothetical protein HKX48_000003 [Thoreauomyces humboldtii]|nr:hypothetical protein HKX48_000003 [Thoreauomyces humboldtii]
MSSRTQDDDEVELLPKPYSPQPAVSKGGPAPASLACGFGLFSSRTIRVILVLAGGYFLVLAAYYVFWSGPQPAGTSAPRLSPEQLTLPTSSSSSSSSNSDELKITAVYMCHVTKATGDRRWKMVLDAQMRDLRTTGPNMTAFYVAMQVPVEEQHSGIAEEAQHIIHNIMPQAQITLTWGNLFEYPGISLLHTLATTGLTSSSHSEELLPIDERHIFLYFHSKGMINSGGAINRTGDDVNLFATVIANWKLALDIFDSHPEVEKVGASAAPAGWMWFNFFYVRQSYLQRVVKPIVTTRRYYYEDYLSRLTVSSVRTQRDNLSPTDVSTKASALRSLVEPIADEPEGGVRVAINCEDSASLRCGRHGKTFVIGQCFYADKSPMIGNCDPKLLQTAEFLRSKNIITTPALAV